MNFQVRRAIVSAAVAGAATLASPAFVWSQSAATTATAPAVPIATAVAADLQQQAATLNDPNTDPRARDDAAQRLMSRHSPEAQQILKAALDNAGNEKAQLSVAKAIAHEPALDPGYVDSLFALVGQDRALSDAAGDALAIDSSNTQILNRLVDLAQNPDSRETARAAALRALGSFADKHAASVLIASLANESNPAAVRNAAGDGLVALTGLTGNGRDLGLWSQWWTVQNAKTDTVFRFDLLTARSQAVDHVRQQQGDAVAELKSLLNDQYAATPDANKDALLLRWMHSTEPTVRQRATELIVEDFQNSRTISQPVRDQLRSLIGDSSPAVRLQVARTLRTINDTGAFDALLVQLAQETVPENKAALALAVSQVPDLRSVPVLEQLLDDSQPQTVVEAGAEAFSNLGAQLASADPKSASDVSAALRHVLEKRTSPSTNTHLRETVVHALVPLRDTSMLTEYFPMLNLRETERVRSETLRALGELRDPRASGTIVDWLNAEPSPAVRVAAIAALRTTGSTEYLEKLYERMQPANEPDATVREQAWQVFSSLLAQANTEQVNRWPGRFVADPDKRVVVLKILADKLATDKNENDLAQTRENIGEALMKSAQPQPAEAAKYFQQSLDYYTKNSDPPMVIERNTTELMQALLLSKQYTEATQFAAKMITDNAENQGTMGPLISDEASRLDDAQDYSSALKLIGEATRMSPALDVRYQRKLADTQAEVIHNQKLAADKKSGDLGPLDPSVRVAQSLHAVTVDPLV